MPRLETSIKDSYISNWNVADGIREFVSNGRDAEVEFNAPFKVDWYQNPTATDPAIRTGVLRLENSGVVLPREAILMGHSSKFGRTDMVGQWGEGISLAMMVLLRAGYPVKIRTGSEVWEPAIERSNQFNAQVLVLNIQEGRKSESRVRVEIGNVSESSWRELKKRFLFLRANQYDWQTIKTDFGDLLMDPQYRQMIFIKGVYVQHNKDLGFGYNLIDARIDRDRKMADYWDVQNKTAKIWSAALSKRPDLLNPFFTLLDQDAPDLEGLKNFSDILSADVKNKITTNFKSKFGNDAIPVQSLEQSKDVEHYGKKGIVVNRVLGSILGQTIGDFSKVQEELKRATKSKFSWHDLSEEEQKNLQEASDLLASVEPGFNLGLVDVVEFFDDKLNGLYKEERLQISHRLIGSFDKTLKTLVHEVAHHISKAGDGDKLHVATIEDIWMKLVRKLHWWNNG